MNKLMLPIVMAASVSVSALASADTSCSDVDYIPEIKAQFPEINEACQEVIERDGEMYTRLDGMLKTSSRYNQLRVQLVLADGSMGPSHYVKKNHPLGVFSDGEMVEYGDLQTNSKVSVYLPHDRFEIVSAPAPVEPEPAMLPETAGSLHWLLIAALGALGLAGFTRRLRK